MKFQCSSSLLNLPKMKGGFITKDVSAVGSVGIIPPSIWGINSVLNSILHSACIELNIG